MKHFLVSYLLGWLMIFGIFGTMALVVSINIHYWPGPPSAEFIGGTFSAIATLAILACLAIAFYGDAL
jgi:hypothetical protein